MPTRPVSLHDYVGRAVPHESASAAIDPALRVAACWALGLDALLAVWILIGVNDIASASAKPGFFLVGWGFFVGLADLGGHANIVMQALVVAIGVGLVLAAWTSGLRKGPLLAHWVTIGFAATGMLAAIPLLLVLGVLAINVAAWVGLVILGLVIAAIVLNAIFS